MKRLALLVCASLFLLVAPILSAHEGHDHTPVSMKKAVEIALATVHDYSLKQPPFGLQSLDKSWRGLPQTAAQIHKNELGYYVVGVTNPQQGKTLYIRILLDASVTGANYTGEFSDVSGSSLSASSAHSH
ncbi:MAG: DUF6488 family protein [Cellvibrio sp.]|uniref:DUF6488 family protein n=1 Tax=Cellvibrio sp. TaxID=1965322 RepID=UPI0031A647AA